MKGITITIICLLTTLLSACSIKGYDTERLSTDFRTEGFIDSDHFQVIVTGFPEKGKKGLVAKRESALENAKKISNNTIIQKLSEYCMNIMSEKNKISQSKITNLNDINIKLNEILVKYLDYRHKAFQYYNADHSAVIVYRIIDNGLKGDLESINIPVEINAK